MQRGSTDDRREEEEGRGEVVSVSMLLALIGVFRKVFDK